MGSSDRCKNLPAKKPPQFFKIILKNAIQEKKLGIPRKYVMEYGSNLRECVTLEGPDGAQWQIYLSKAEDGQVWLEQGWLDFSKHYSLKHGNLLVFNPLEMSKFSVVMFDVSGMEINYAPMNNTIRSSESHFDRETEMKNDREDSSILCHRPLKRKRADNCNTCESGSSVAPECGTLRLKKAKRDADSHVSLQNYKFIECGGLKKARSNDELHVSSQEFRDVYKGGYTPSTQRCQTKDGQKNERFILREKAMLLERTRDFKSSKPYFKAVIHPSAVNTDRQARLGVPTEFAKKYFTQENRNVILQNENRKFWSVKYKSEAVSDRSTFRAKLAGGWKDFFVDNNLEVGDVCVFEMIKDREMTFNVVIFRTRKSGDVTSIPRDHQPKDGGAKQTLSSKQKAELLKKAPDFKCTKPHFKVVMQSSSVYRKYRRTVALNVPAKFAKKYLTNDKQDVLFYDVKGRTCPVSYHCNDSTDNIRGRFIKGWKIFAEDNNLNVGDVCFFQMNYKNITFKVIIFRNSEAANCFASPGKSACLENVKSADGDVTNTDRWSCPVSCNEANKSIKVKNEANESVTTYPWFAVEMKSSYVQGSCLTIPRSFARNYIKAGTSTVKLNVGDKSWQINVFNYQDGASRFSGGWTTFAKENALKPMDVCKFELIQQNDYTFRVSIIRDTSHSRKSAGLENDKSSGSNITGTRSCLNLWDAADKSTKIKNEPSNFMTAYPWFTVEMEDPDLQGWCLKVPSSFAKHYIKTGASTITLNVEDKSWQVNLFKYQDGACKISAGWTTFVTENSLKSKDMCKFELIQRNGCFFRVSMLRNTS